MEITKEMTIGEIIMIDEGLIEILLDSGMHCIGCPSAQGESLEEACVVHGLPVEPIVARLNAYLATKQSELISETNKLFCEEKVL